MEKLKSLHIDRFGARSNLHLDPMSERLNVIYGPNGSGKTTMIRFLRWMLLGNPDGQLTHYLATASGPARGTLTVLSDGAAQQIERLDDGTPRGHAVVHRSEGDSAERTLPGGGEAGSVFVSSLLPDALEFDRIFCLGFDVPYRLNDLVTTARRRGIELTYDQRQLDQLAELQKRYELLRDRLRATSGSDASLSVLQDRRDETLRRLEELKWQQRRVEQQVEQQRHDLLAQLHPLQQQRDQLRTMIDRIEEVMERRRQEAQQQWRQVEAQWQQQLQQRRRKLEDIDQQIQQWRQMLQSVRGRAVLLQQQTNENRSSSMIPVRDDEQLELRYLLQMLGCRGQEIDADLEEFQELGFETSQPAQLHYLRSVMGAALDSMRDDVYRLCHLVEQQRQRDEQHQWQAEGDHLRRLERDLGELIDELSRQRDELATASGSGATLRPVTDNLAERTWLGGTARAVAGDRNLRDLDPSANGNSLATDSSSFSPLARRIQPWLDARLRHLQLRVDQLRDHLRDMEEGIERVRRELDTLDTQRLRPWESAQVESLEAEVRHIDQQIQAVHERDRQESELERLESEIRQLQATLRESDTLRQASTILRDMTDGQHTRVRIAHDGQVWVDDGHRRWAAFEHLSRGTRDQVYLSLCLALVAHYRQIGIELPLILNDVFINIDSERARDTAKAIEAFALNGHQVVVFTRHEHILQLFRPLDGRFFSLRPRSAAAAAPSDTCVPAANHRPLPPVSQDLPAGRPASGPVEPQWIARWREPVGSEPQAPRSTRAGESPTAAPMHEIRSLGPSSSLASTTALDRSVVDALLAYGVESVEQFLALDPDQAESDLMGAGITAPLLRRWQAELALQCHAGLSGPEARLLIGCGIEDLSTLAGLEAEAVARRIDAYLVNSDLQRIFGRARDYDRPRISRWIHAARSAVQRLVGATPWAPPADREPRAPRLYRERSGGSAARRSATSDTARRSATSDTAHRSATDEAPPAETARLRFYLELSDPVVDAPSIGPKTAELLAVIQIHTVAELLKTPAETIAERCEQSRITAELVHQWQLQARMVCRVPNLRGHDAQLLIACDVCNPEKLAEQRADQLWERIDAFCDSNEGRRILRSGRKPDLNEVTSWVRWARSARKLVAA